jgi:uncharacterized membrane protein YqjE
MFSRLSMARALIRGFLDERAEALTAMWRAELRRAAVVRACSLMLSFFVVAAVGFAVFAVILAYWETHRVLAAAGVSIVLAVCAVASGLTLHRHTQQKKSGD